MQVLYDTLINQLRGQGFRYGITNDQFHFSSLMQKFANLLEMFLIAVWKNKILFSKQQFKASLEQYFYFKPCCWYEQSLM